MTSNAKKPNPYLLANFLSKLSFWWTIEIFQLGKTGNLRPENLYDILPESSSESLGNQLEKSWDDELAEVQMKNKRPSLYRVIRKTFWRQITKDTLGLLISNFFYLIQPLFLSKLLQYFERKHTMSIQEACIYASALVSSIIVQMVCMRHVILSQYITGMHMRIACTALIYRKVLKLSSTSANSTTNGYIISVMSNDLSKLERSIIYFPFLWLMPVLCLTISYFTWYLLGDAAIVGILVMVIQVIPPQVILHKVAKKLQAAYAASTDKRMMLIGEIISGMKVIKMYAWENYFEKLVHLARRCEISKIRKLSYVKAINWTMPMFTDRVSVVFMIYTYLYLGHTISADIIFPAVQYFTLTRQYMASLWLDAVFYSSMTKVAIRRMEKFLLYDEMNPITASSENTRFGEICIKSLEASWSNLPILIDINLRVSPKKLCAIVGPIGSGKSSLLKLILSELKAKSGSILVLGTVSYVSQEPWLFSGSVKSNILFGENYDEEKYKKVVNVCHLLRDFEQLPFGDKTLVGEKGVRLSGGQCARVNLARAIYRDADIYLFDDPLSALDAQVGKSLFEDCISGLLKNKTRIFVTHQLQLLKKVDDIVVMDNGRIMFQGNYETFIEGKKNLDCLSLCNKEQRVEEVVNQTQRSSSVGEEENATGYEEEEIEEVIAKGHVKKSHILKFFTANSSCWSLSFMALFCLLTQFTISVFDYWLSFWTKQEENKKMYSNFSNNNGIEFSTTKPPDKYFSSEIALYVCGSLVVAILVLSIIKNTLFFKVILNSSETVHNKMFSRLQKAPLIFFTVNPSGRITNRFSKDTGTVDDEIPDSLMVVIEGLLLTLAVTIQVIITNWWAIFPVIIVGYLLVKINVVYLMTAQSLKRLEGTAKSPVFSLVNSTFMGLDTIRSCKAQKIVQQDFDKRQDANTAVAYLGLVTSTAFSLWLQLLVSCIMTFIVYSFIFIKSEATMAGDVGLALTQIMSICGLILQYVMRQFATLMTQMTSVERMFEYTELDQEGSSKSECYQIPALKWPSKGEVTFKNLYLRYSDEMQPVLKNLNFTISPNMKVGVIGRTGAGKSSLIAALFRLAEYDGSLFIDNVNIKNISLSDLRSKISIIPQEPVIFTTSLRDNLDPLGQYDDASLWSLLRDVKMDKMFTNLEQLVDGNLSAGQRQLICLCRAILRKNKILILDEATANIDPVTDAFIQEIIRSKFRDCTVLTIAHKLNTVMDSDAILVMDDGQVVEFDHPQNLQKNCGYFSKIVTQSENSSQLPPRSYR